MGCSLGPAADRVVGEMGVTRSVAKICKMPGIFNIAPSSRSGTWVSRVGVRVDKGTFQSHIRGSKVRGHTVGVMAAQFGPSSV